MVDRILELLKSKNMTPSQFADEIGIQRSGMSHLLSGRNKPSLEFIMKILKRYPEVTADWLLYGKAQVGAGQNSRELTSGEKEATLFDLMEIPEEKQKKMPLQIQNPSASDKERKVEKIVVFYDDKTFREYNPEG